MGDALDPSDLARVAQMRVRDVAGQLEAHEHSILVERHLLLGEVQHLRRFAVEVLPEDAVVVAVVDADRAVEAAHRRRRVLGP